MPFKFAYLCDLFQRLEDLELQDRDVPLLVDFKRDRYEKTVAMWFRSYRGFIDAPETDLVALLSSLLPERRTDRVYALQPPSLLRVLGRSLGFGTERLQRLKSWTNAGEGDLPSWVSNIVKVTDAGMAPSNITVEEIDNTLEKVAARCRFSALHVRSKSGSSDPTTVDSLLKPILCRLPSHELKWFLRLVLKNYHPVVLEEHLVLRHVHFLLPKLLKFQSDFAAAVEILRKPTFHGIPAQPDRETADRLLNEMAAEWFGPQIGTKIGRPTFLKARSFDQCLKLVKHGRWAVEPKFDGEYCQVHVDLSKGRDCIQIFSKSGRDSTEDRRDLHDAIIQSLMVGSPGCKFKQRCILEGEMVIFDSRTKSISEFHKIRKHVSRAGSYLGTENDSPAHPHENLMILFFDALLIDDEVTMSLPYHERRRRLKTLVLHFEGLVERSDWGMIDFSRLSERRGTQKLQRQFSKSISRRLEGLVLKPYDSPYLSPNQSATDFGGFVKLKRDYIPGLGDTADFALIGASRDVRENIIAGAKWNRFTIACITNKEDVARYRVEPVFRVIESICRPCIPEVDARYISDTGRFVEACNTGEACLGPEGLVTTEFDARMDVRFTTPFVVEVLGSGFDKPPCKGHYALRHPRIIKIHGDRGVEDVVSFDELQKMAHEAISIPTDLTAEESKWQQRLQTACQSKRPKYVTNRSPFSETTSTRSKSSPTTTPSKVVFPPKAPQSTAHIESPEMLRRGGKEASSSPRFLVVSDKPTVEQAQTLTLPPTSSINARIHESQNKEHMNKLHNPSAARKRKVDDATSPAISSGSKRRAPSAPAYSVNSIDAQHAAVQCKKKGPLSDITNNPTNAASFRSSNETGQGVVSEQLNLNDVVHFAENISSQDTNDSYHSVVTQLNKVQLKLSKDVGHSSSRPAPLPDPSRSKSESRNSPNRGANPKPRESIAIKDESSSDRRATALLVRSVVYLSPCVQNIPFLTEDLLPILSPAHITHSITHWSRDLLYLPPSAPVVGESQAFPGFQKIVLVEAKRRSQTNDIVERLKGIKLGVDEEVNVWDWRFAELLTELLVAQNLQSSPSSLIGYSGSGTFGVENETSPRPKDGGKSDITEQLLRQLARCYLGKLTIDDDMQKSTWLAADSATKHNIASALVQSLVMTQD